MAVAVLAAMPAVLLLVPLSLGGGGVYTIHTAGLAMSGRTLTCFLRLPGELGGALSAESPVAMSTIVSIVL